ncbi:hypothetical protein SISSUDRAFT_1050258 [Sistotremastrum suecicum HHB10207 ss-3]|uniref:HAD-like protein n=1 Tax=Sistotremastrum suecicum HHB10207 ss-3 TaxID=1314776 RepID=A0A166BA05_9AGAM|nr:hypothetical protein SISSUDRAFT_1050258 [Sistotremastrum suecicum HHB10207 ss-3]
MSSTSEVPESTLPYPPLHLNKKFIALSDWDGTITNRDTNDYLTDTLGFGPEKRRADNLEILAGHVTFRDAFREMLASVAEKHAFEECKAVLKTQISLDPGFKDFYNWCKVNDIPVVIVSSGMAPLIRAILSNLIGEEEAAKIDIISNDVKIEQDGKWSIQYRHPSSGFGHDKSQAILPYRELPSPPTLFFFGDGVSDMSAARHADLLFVKQKPGGENDLAAYCRREGIKHVLFEDFTGALGLVKAVVGGEKTVAEALESGRV